MTIEKGKIEDLSYALLLLSLYRLTKKNLLVN